MCKESCSCKLSDCHKCKDLRISTARDGKQKYNCANHGREIKNDGDCNAKS